MRSPRPSASSGGQIETERRVTSFAELERGRRRRLRPGARGRRGDRRRAPAAPASLAPTAATATGPARSSSTSRSRAVCRGRTRPAGGPGPSTWSERFEEIVIAERAINRGSMPERPFVLVGQQYLADPGRSEGDLHPVWVYAHVPQRLLRRRRARRCSARSSASPRASASGSWRAAVRGPAELAAYNANYVGGDIITGANTPVQVLIRPRLALDPYSTGIPGVYICSAATPPGAGRPRDERVQRGAVRAPPSGRLASSVVPTIFVQYFVTLWGLGACGDPSPWSTSVTRGPGVGLREASSSGRAGSERP